MYPNYQSVYRPTTTYGTTSMTSMNSAPYRPISNSNDRLIGGGFFGPFLLGGITGGLLAPNFYPRPMPYGPYPPPYPIYY